MTSTFSITYNSESSDDRGVYVVRRPDIPAPEPIYETYEIPGHDGILMPVDKRYAPLEIDVELNFISTTPNSWGYTYRAVKEWLMGYGLGFQPYNKNKLIFSDDTTHFYKVYYVTILESERTSRRIGSLTAHFVCDPYCYRISGETPIALTAEAQTIYNPSSVTAKPMFAFGIGTGIGTVDIVCNGKTFSFERSPEINMGYAIKTEEGLVLAQKGNETMIWNSHSSGNFEDLYFPRGANVIYSNSGATAVNPDLIYPYWREL